MPATSVGMAPSTRHRQDACTTLCWRVATLIDGGGERRHRDFAQKGGPTGCGKAAESRTWRKKDLVPKLFHSIGLHCVWHSPGCLQSREAWQNRKKSSFRHNPEPKRIVRQQSADTEVAQGGLHRDAFLAGCGCETLMAPRPILRPVVLLGRD